jgi:4-amino-4-deoxy-L-arabinose transferase-like glycosyltransferase
MRQQLFGQGLSCPTSRSVVVLIVILVIYGILLASKIGAYAGGSDSSGYLNDARLLSDGQLIIEQRVIEGLQSETLPIYTYVPLGFVPTASHQMIPTYPMGLPLMILGMSYLTGWAHAADATLLLNALLSIIVLYFLARLCGLSRSLASLATIILGSSAIFLFQSLLNMSDVPALAWCSLAILLAMLARRDDRWALASGAVVAMSVLVRPSDALVIVPVAIAIGFSWRKWVWLFIGGSPGVVFVSLLNLELYGSILKTGYGDVGGFFDFGYVPLGLAAYARWLPKMLTPGIFIIVLAPFLLRSRPLVVAILGGWTLSLLGFYSAYLFTHENWTYMRFPLPAFGSIIILMLLIYQKWLRRLPSTARRIANLAALVSVLAWNGYWAEDYGALNVGKGEKAYFLATEWIKANLPQNSVLVAMQATGALLYYTNFTFVRWDQLTKPRLTDVEQAATAAGSPIYAVLFPFERKEVLEQRMPGHWDLMTTIDPITIWRRGPPS